MERQIDTNLIEKAAEALRQGQLVAFPTETVYGLGADAKNPEALRRLYRVKGRPTSHPVIVHLGNTDQLAEWAASVPPAAYLLAEAFWPGPLTMILPRASHVLDHVTGGQNSVGVRIPSHPLALALIKAFGSGIAAPSANRFGRLSPTSAEDVRMELGDQVAMVLDGGSCQVGIESTIVDLTRATPVILRPGMVLASELERFLGKTDSDLPPDKLTRAPGGLPSHYAPETPIKLVASGLLLEEIERLGAAGHKAGVLAFAGPPVNMQIPWVVASRNPIDYARNLYRHLRWLDAQRCYCLLVESIPNDNAWSGIKDRLTKASAPRPRVE